MLGNKKEKVPFGRRPNKGSFGKKPSKGNFGRKNSFLKPVSKKKKANKAEREFLSWLHEPVQLEHYGCFVCGKYGLIEWHHVKENSTCKKDHTRLIPLCGETCHRDGKELSAHGTPVKFREAFPIEVQLKYAAKIHGVFLAEKQE